MGLTTVKEELVERSRASISGATQANPCVVTATAHGFENGDRVYLASLAGMTELNDREFTVAGKTANTFELSGEDSTAHSAYTSGGVAIQRLGTAADANVGTGANQIVQLDGSSQLPAVDGSQLTGLPSGWTLAAHKTLNGLTNVSWTGLPASITAIRMEMYNGVSLAGGTNMPSVVLGHGGTPTYVASGYTGRTTKNNAAPGTAHSTYFPMAHAGQGASVTFGGRIDLHKMNGDVWAGQSICTFNGNMAMGTGYVDVTATLTALKLEATGGTTFDAGEASLYYQ